MNKLELSVTGNIIYATPADNIDKALGKLRDLFSGANIDVSGMEWVGVMVDENDKIISPKESWQGDVLEKTKGRF